MARKPPKPLVHVIDLIGKRPVSLERARANRARMVLPQTPRDHLPGLTPFRTAVDLWAAVQAGGFPPPVRGPWGTAWPRADVNQWLKEKGPERWNARGPKCQKPSKDFQHAQVYRPHV